MPFAIVRNNLLAVHADALVNSANHKPVVGHGVDSAIYQKAGSKLLAARELIGDISYGDAAITPGFDLDAKFVIHAVTPIWNGGEQGETKLLENCYIRSLQLALTHKCESFAFPLLVAGNNGFPRELALQIAVHAIRQFLADHEMQIYLVVFDKKSFVLSGSRFSSVKSFIDEQFVRELVMEEFELEDLREDYDIEEVRRSYGRRRRRTSDTPPRLCMSAAPMERPPKSGSGFPSDLENMLKNLDESFSQSLTRMISQRGLTDPEVYKKANVDRKLFSKIRSNRNYRPKKTTAVAFAIALQLTLDETRAFLAKAGYAMSHSSKFDIIIEYFLHEHNYNVFEINETLFAFDQPLIGC